MRTQIASSPLVIKVVKQSCEKGSLRQPDTQGNCVCSLELSADIGGRSSACMCACVGLVCKPESCNKLCNVHDCDRHVRIVTVTATFVS